jgi:hypothetical protein
MGIRHFRVHNVAMTREILLLHQSIHGISSSHATSGAGARNHPH